MDKPPLHYYLNTLSFKAVHIQCLDKDGSSIKHAYATGFIVRENEQLFLYTCWHVVTGYNMHNIELKHSPPNRKFLRVTLQDCQKRKSWLEVLGSNQTITIPLYDANVSTPMPLWYQDETDVPDPDLNEINIKVPFRHDVIKIPLPSDLCVSETQIISSEDIFINSPSLGEKVYIVGYPYGYSALGKDQPTPIVLIRFVASQIITGRREEFLLDGPGAPGMSGAPVFVERDNALLLSGLYTGLIYPDYAIDQNEKTTALGTYCNLVVWWQLLDFKKKKVANHENSADAKKLRV